MNLIGEMAQLELENSFTNKNTFGEQVIFNKDAAFKNPTGAPFTVDSSTVVPRLNADMVDGVEGTTIVNNISTVQTNLSNLQTNTNKDITALQTSLSSQTALLKNEIKEFVPKNTVFNSNGSITETYSDGVKLTTFNSNGSITEKFTGNDGKVITKTTTFNSDGSITEGVV